MDKLVTLESLEGAVSTIISGDNNSRCLYLSAADAIVDGFTITDGWSTYGGGVLFDADATLRNCLVTRNSAYSYNAGSELHPNWVGGQGGGIQCLGSGKVVNCTVVENVAVDLPHFRSKGGGIHCEGGGRIINSIILNNTAGIGTNWFTNGTGAKFSFCSTDPDIGDHAVTGSVHLSSSLRLTAASACIDGGTSSNAPATDMDGESRWDHPEYPNIASIVDVGADEFVDLDGDSLADWQETHELGSDPALSDTDGDGLDDGEEIIAGTSLTNDASSLEIVAAGMVASGASFVVTWESVTGRLYSVQVCPDFECTWSNLYQGSGTGGEQSYTNVQPGLRGYYRIGVELLEQ